MPPKKQRVPVVVDTNVFLRAFRARDGRNPNKRVVRLWLQERKLQLVVSPSVIQEYVGVFERVVGLGTSELAEWRARFERDNRCTVVGETGWRAGSRDPADNVFVATARTGKARFLVTNDLDLLHLPEEVHRGRRLAIVTPRRFLAQPGLPWRPPLTV
jgi:putative PIN family toxin of toxin-antitoxin system